MTCVATSCTESYLGEMEFREKLAKLLMDRRLSQAELGRLAGVSQGSISGVIAGKHKLTFESARKIARVLNVSLDYLADDCQDDPPRPQFSEEQRGMLRMLEVAGVRDQVALFAVLRGGAGDRSGDALRGRAVVDLEPHPLGGADRVPDRDDKGIGTGPPKRGQPGR